MIFELFLLLSGLSLAATSVYLFSSTLLANNTDANALAWATGNEPDKSKSGLINYSRPLVHNFTLQHAMRIKNPDYRKRVEKKIMTAGLANEINVDEFIGLQILWGFALPIVLVVLKFTLGLGFPYFVCIGVGLLGTYFPHFYCRAQTEIRYSSVLSELPFFIDLLALSTQAGLEFMGAVERIVSKASKDSVLAAELRTVLKDIQLGASRTDALKGLTKRIDLPEVISFVTVVNDAAISGAEVATVLKDQSDQMRLERFVRAEKAGAKASQTMLFPMVFFIFPAVFVVIFGPAIVNFFYGGSD